MKTKINFLLFMFFSLGSTFSQTLVEHQQVWIDESGNIAENNFENFISLANQKEGSELIIGINNLQSTVTFSTTLFWPQGTWLHGYYDRSDQFWDDDKWKINCTYVNLGFPSSHPLVRINSKMIRSLIHSNHIGLLNTSLVNENIQTIKEGLDYMISQQKNFPADPVEDGGFTYWFTRPFDEIPNLDESPGGNFTHAYETTHALRTMCEAYMYFQDNGIAYSNMPGLYNAIVKAADNLERKDVSPSPPPTPISDDNDESCACDLSNSNFKGLAIWALAGAYKVTQDTRYFNKSKLIADKLISYQTTDGSIQDGMWITGGVDKGADGCGLSVPHDTHIWYHCMILRGLAEVMDITPDEEVAWKITLIAHIKKAINHIINYRIAYYNDASMGIEMGMLRKTWTSNFAGITCGQWGFYYGEEVVETIAMIALYSEFQTYFSCNERKILRNLLLTMGIQAHSTYYLENFVSYAYYADYFNAFEKHERIFPGFEKNNFISPFTGITYYSGYTVPPGVDQIDHPNEINFSNLVVPANASLTVTSSIRIKAEPNSRASSGSYFHAFITEPECPGLSARIGNINNDGLLASVNQTTKGNNYAYPDRSMNSTGSPILEKPLPINQNNNSLAIFPNPSASGIFSVSGLPVSSSNSVCAYNVLGEEVYHSSANLQTQASIDISSRPKGIYFVKLITGEEIYIQKIIYR